MMRMSWGIVLVLGTVAIGQAFQPDGKPSPAGKPDLPLVEETWETAHVEGVRIGFRHTTVQRVERDGDEYLRATAVLDLTFKRHNALLHLSRTHGTEESAEGKVVGVFMNQGQEGGRQVVLTGAVEGGRLHVRFDNGRLERRIWWSEEVVGLYRLEHFFQQHRPKPAETFSLLIYDPTYNAVLTVRAAVQGPEEVPPSPEVRERSGQVLKKLLRVNLTPDKLEVPGVSVQPPPTVWWLDEEFLPVRRQIELEGLGTVVLTRTTREAALAAVRPSARSVDIGANTLVPLDRTIPRPYASRSAVYQITLRGDSDPASALVSDAHQEVHNPRGDTFELHVHPVRFSPRGQGSTVPAPEFLASCHFIDCDHPAIQQLARRITGGEKDPWTKARRLERWVKQTMRPDNTVALGPASEVATRLRGDCRQYALLLTGLCRAAGVPARTAVGLLYVEKNRRPSMGFHMWTEVWDAGQWLGLDGTLGQGGVSAAHVKIADHSWHDAQSLTPLLPANRVLGKIALRVVSVDTAE
jgi:transglutaminase-like putative cysteine protease